MSASHTPTPFTSSHLYRPVLVFIGVTLALQLGGVDLQIADWIYHRWGDAWVWQNAWITRTAIHEGGRTLVGVLLLAVLVLCAGAWLLPAGRSYRKPLLYLVVSAVSAALVINVLKEFTHIDCPWDLARYGGTDSYADLFDVDTWSRRHGACFPAGHASAGYAWFGLYYLAREYRPRWRAAAFGGVMLLGLVFGIGQQLRGAHFVSHDWWTACLCWFTATGCYCLFFPSRCAATA